MEAFWELKEIVLFFSIPHKLWEAFIKREVIWVFTKHEIENVKEFIVLNKSSS